MLEALPTSHPTQPSLEPPPAPQDPERALLCGCPSALRRVGAKFGVGESWRGGVTSPSSSEKLGASGKMLSLSKPHLPHLEGGCDRTCLSPPWPWRNLNPLGAL